MQIICPHCNFSKRVEAAKIPAGRTTVNCPRCSQRFVFDKSVKNQGPAAAAEYVTCPACGLVQLAGETCSGCGVIYQKFQSRLAEKEQQEKGPEPLYDNLLELRRKAEEALPQNRPKAGFWLRVVASMIDSLLLGVVQVTLSLLISLVIHLLGVAAGGDGAINLVIWLFGASLGMGYAVFFTGYCGQTPGKMALRIKVIRTDGRQLSYSRATLREIFGKFISGLLLCIGYLMVIFDDQKQGLHDRIADTYVIKL